jgi:hypothetical protein
MAHMGPRLIVNDLGARSTNLLHGVSLRPSAPPAHALAVAMCSSLTLLSAEIEGRAYGGGVLKVETREAERLVIPAFGEAKTALLIEMFDDVDALVRRGDASVAAAAVDQALGLDHETLWNACRVYRDRRLGRRRASSG